MVDPHMFDPLGEDGAGGRADSGQGEEFTEAKAEDIAELAWLRGQVDKSVPVSKTLAERYLTDFRQLPGPYPESVRYAANYQVREKTRGHPSLLAIVTGPDGSIVALQSLELNPETGAKARMEKPDRFSKGRVSTGTVFLGAKESPVPTLVIGEGIESVLSRCQVGPCDAHACLGGIREVKPQRHHKRIEILADTDSRDKSRKLARQYADAGYNAYVVTVPDALGPKADLNDALQDMGLEAVRVAVEDAEFIAGTTRSDPTDFALEIGSDIEIAQAMIEKLEDIYGPVVVSDGKIWRFDRSHWLAFEVDPLARFIHRADGATYQDGDREGRVRLNKSRVNSILDAMLKYKQDGKFFEAAPCGINCGNGFIQIRDGVATLQPHARKWRQRHVVAGRYESEKLPDGIGTGKLYQFIEQAFSGDDDAPDKINLLGEIAGCVALGRGTQLANPKAIITYSEEGGTGKSTYLKLLRALPNPEAVASVPPGKFSDEKYTFRLIGKVLNAADELPEKAIKSDVFKRLVTGEPVPARNVYGSATDFIPVALHVFSTNVLPGFSGGIDGGTARRLLPIEFTHVVPENERDPLLVEKIIRDEADELLRFAVDGACRLLKQGDFTVPASSRQLLNQWFLSTDPVRAWAAGRLEVTEYDRRIAVATLYEDFKAYAASLGIKPDFLPSSIAFGKRLRSAAPGLEFLRSDGSYCRNAQLRT